MTNSADPDQKPTDLDLHCLLRQFMTCLAREGLTYFPCSWTMYADWASLQDEIKFDKANKSVLHKFPSIVGRDVACSVVKTIAQNLSIAVSNPDPSNLETDKDVKWTMEV